MAGKVNADTASAALVAADVVIGAGWGGTATLAIGTGSNDQRGSFTVTASATTPAQATATIVVTYKLAWQYVPFVVVSRGGGTAVMTVFPQVTATSKTAFTIRSNTLPVAGETTEFFYIVL